MGRIMGCLIGALGLTLVAVGCSAQQPQRVKTEHADAPQPPAVARAPEPDPGYDECSLVTPAELARAVGVPKLTVADRTIYPDVKGKGWRVGCGYEAEPGSGAGTYTVTTYTGVEQAEEVFDGMRPDAEPVPGLGEHAALTMDSNVSRDWAAASADLRILQDSAGIRIGYSLYDEKVGDTRRFKVDSRALKALGRKAVEQLPRSPRIVPEKATGPCGKLQRAAVETALAAPFVASRSALRPDGSVTCFYAGKDNWLMAQLVIAPRLVKAYQNLAPGQGELARLGKVHFSAQHQDGDKQTTLNASIANADKAIAINANYSVTRGGFTSTRPGPADRAMLLALHDAFT